MTPIDQRVDWEGLKRCLAVLHRESKTFLGRSLLIGGAASWFYRIQLNKANDSDFREPPESLASSETWLSKDIDFTGIFRADAFEMLPGLIERDQAGNRILKVRGIRLGFAQVGVTFDPSEAFAKARVAEFSDAGDRIQFLVIDPITLYREKLALSQKRNQTNDRFHLAVLREILSLEFVGHCQRYAGVEEPSILEQKKHLEFLLETKARAIEITQDSRVIRRLEAIQPHHEERTRFIRETFDL